MSKNGYITIQRKITDWRWWGNETAMALWLYILVNANWKDGWWNAGAEQVKRGEFITSQVKIANEMKLNRKTVARYLKLFVEDGQIEVIADSKKTRIKVINYAKYQDVPDDDGQLDGQVNGQVNGQHSGQQDGQQDGQLDGHNRTIINQNKPYKPLNQYIHQWFEEFWKQYPRKEGKQNAMKAFEKQCKNEDTFKAIMDGLQKRVKLDWSRRPAEEKKFIPHPSSWLNQSRWNDEVTPYAGKGEGIFAGITGKPEDYREPSAEYEKSIEEFFGE